MESINCLVTNIFQNVFFCVLSYLLSVEVRNSYKIGTTRQWVDDDRIWIFGWKFPLRSNHSKEDNYNNNGNYKIVLIILIPHHNRGIISLESLSERFFPADERKKQTKKQRQPIRIQSGFKEDTNWQRTQLQHAYNKQNIGVNAIYIYSYHSWCVRAFTNWIFSKYRLKKLFWHICQVPF